MALFDMIFGTTDEERKARTAPARPLPSPNPLPQMQMPAPANPSGEIGMPQPTTVIPAGQPQQLPDITMEAPVGFDPEAWAQAPAEVKTKGKVAEDALNELRGNTGASDTWFENFGKGVNDFFGNKENMLSLALAFNTLRYEPDQGLASVISKQLETRQALRTQNKTAQALLASSDPMKQRVGQLMSYGGLTYKEALAASKQSDFDKKLAMIGGDISKWKDTYGGGGVTVDLGEKEDVKRTEAFIKRMEANVEGRTQAINAQASVEALMAIGENPDLNKIPSILRGFIPRGLSSPIDAYKAALVGVAQSQRQAGTGAQSDKDIDLLIQKAGPISTDVKARRIAQQALLDKARRDAEVANISNSYLIGKMTKEEASNKIDEIYNKPLISPELRGYLDSLSGGAAAANLTPPANAPAELVQVWTVLTPEERQQAIDELGAQ